MRKGHFKSHRSSGQGNRGRAFEEYIDFNNSLYLSNRLAVVTKLPTAMKIVGTQGNKHTAVFDKKSTVDYYGVYAGRPILFDAKSVARTSFPLNMVHAHQVDYLERVEEQGGIAFLLVELREADTTFYLPLGMLRKYLKDARQGGRKSIPIADFEVYAYEVRRGRVPLDYLAVVDKLLERGQVG